MRGKTERRDSAAELRRAPAIARNISGAERPSFKKAQADQIAHFAAADRKRAEVRSN
jgi:hypothetical protein